MSTVTLSKPHCAITSAENPEGIASQAFTTALPEGHTFLTLFATVFSFPFAQTHRHCEERSDEAIHSVLATLDCFASLAMTLKLLHGPLYARLAHADFARGVHYRRPGIVRQGYAVFGAIGAHFCFRLARDQHGIGAGGRLGILEVADVARNLAVEEIAGVDHFGIDINREHAVGEAPVRPGRAGAGQRTAEQFADERQTRALVLAERADRALALAVVAGPFRTVRSIKYRRIFAQATVEIDQRALRQFLAASACDQHLAFRDDRSGKIQHASPLTVAL